MSKFVTVILSVFNSAPKLRGTIESVLSQSFSDYEFIIVDDGSFDDTAAVLNKMVANDTRVRVVKNDSNIGLTRSLNKALSLAQGEVIARIDAGDLWAPAKLEHQVAFWNKKKTLCVLGTQAKIMDANGVLIKETSLPINDAEIRKYMFTGLNPFIHSSVLFKNGFRYNPAYLCAQDIALWRSMYKHGQLSNLESALVTYESNSKSISYRKKAYQVYYGYDSFQCFVLENTGISGNRVLCGTPLSNFWATVFGKLYSRAAGIPGVLGKLVVCLVYITYPRVFLIRLFDRLLAIRALGVRAIGEIK